MASPAANSHGVKDASPASLKKRLREAGLRATSARAAVLRCLLSTETPLSHADVCAELESLGYDRATLYRNLIDLTDVGLVRRTALGDHVWRFEASSSPHAAEAHPHFVCTDCGEVTCLPGDAIDVKPGRGIPRAVQRAEVEIQVRGRCNECA
ncbi:MAG: Fur family transcriptional regulator [Sandaracinaceae bacterium]